ncbi:MULTISPECIES: RDD family protein [Polaribacter]|uniref:RDD family protein n=1 Tax=Polaribacter sejongensis TaxID=985043 RepID=A0ABN5F6P1_9FLAO|nr:MULTISPECIES: RDD family protein [Polaribacter]AUC23223.1 RDD family protein [Polaribacter sejongensis]
MNEIQTHGYKLASKGKRLIATIIEGLIFGVLFLVIYLIMGKSVSEFWADFESDFQFLDIIYSLVTGIIIGAIFYPIFIGNLGHRIYNLKVISEETGEDYNKPEKGAIREGLKHVLGYLLIPSIWILWDKKNQNLYDKITKTLVVEKKTNE